MNISFNQASAKFGEREVLAPISICLTEKRIGVIGLNGSGKSTFTRMVNGLVLPKSGHVVTNGYDTKKDGAKVRACVGYVFQNPSNQIVLPLIKDDIALGLQARKMKGNELEHAIADVLDRIGIAHLADRHAHELSGGEIQLAALASVLVTSPDIVIMDEPTNQLDLKNRNIVRRAISDLPENVIVVTHDLSLLTGFERVLLFHQGKLVGDGPTEAIISRYLDIAE